MIIDKEPEYSYRQELQKHTAHLEQLQGKKNKLGWLRLFLFLLLIFLVYESAITYGVAGWIGTAVTITIFLYIISVDADNNRAIRFVTSLLRQNEEELQILNGDYYTHYDGIKFNAPSHPYANDLDVFGKASLFQYINRCATEGGQKQLADNLLQPLSTEKIEKRGAAVRELTPLLQWRQQFHAFASNTPITLSTEQKISAWLNQDMLYFRHPAWKIIIIVYSIITLSSACLAITGILSTYQFSLLFLVYFFVASFFSRKATAAYNSLNGIVGEVGSLANLLTCIEIIPFKSEHLQALQGDIQQDNVKASQEIKQLQKILNRFDMRLNVFVFFFLNSFLLWDVQQMRALNTWKNHNRNRISKWFEVIAEIEVLHSLSTLYFNNPEWCFPQLQQEYFTLKGMRIGHPLILKKARVYNDFEIGGTGQIGLITGSNMAGKSTFLRSLGVNVILAQMGAPVCAQQFFVSPVKLLSSMRIMDNLADNTSTFYAELKKLQTIIEAVKQHLPIFILLDEILRGTNSLDRHTGSEALLKQLIKEESVAVIATHDVALAGLEAHFPQAIHNYHFDVQVNGEELYFDYKLKTGVCTSLNASILMKKIGIEVS